jgi:hypothetical protein
MSNRSANKAESIAVNFMASMESQLFFEVPRIDSYVDRRDRAPGGGASGLLLAVDGRQCVFGANRVARASLLLDDRGLQAGASVWTIFERSRRTPRFGDCVIAAMRPSWRSRKPPWRGEDFSKRSLSLR